MDVILAIDQGTHASRSLLFDLSGRCLARTEQTVDLFDRGHSHVEQDAEQLLSSIQQVICKIINQHPQHNIIAAGLATQRSTLVAWDKVTGKALIPAISWQDRRCAEIIHSLRKNKQITPISGLPLSPHYLAGKIKWLLHSSIINKTLFDNKHVVIGSLSSYLCFNLLQGQPSIIDHSNAARSQLFDLESCQWSTTLLKLFNIPENLLPHCAPVSHQHGRLKESNINLNVICGDQNAALFAYGKPSSETLLMNIGSGAFVLRYTANRHCPINGLLSGLAASTKDGVQYHIEGTINGAGNALTLLQQEYKEDSLTAHLEDYLAQTKNPPLFINGVGGVGSPWWIAKLDSHYIPTSNTANSTDDLSLAEKSVALIESIVFMLFCNLERMTDAKLPLPAAKRIIISGGLSQLDGLCQRMADISHLPVVRYNETEATARGCAWLSFSQLAQTSNSKDTWIHPDPEKTFLPDENTSLFQRYQRFILEMSKQ